MYRRRLTSAVFVVLCLVDSVGDGVEVTAQLGFHNLILLLRILASAFDLFKETAQILIY